MTSSKPDWRLFWAKTDRGGYLGRGDRWTHPLWAHLLDVACVAEALFERLPAPVRASLARQLGVTEEQAKTISSLVIGLHDVGKAIPSFQTQGGETTAKAREEMKAAGLSFDRDDERRHHGHASIPILLGWVASLPNSDSARPLLRSLAAFVGFHHGRLLAKQGAPSKPGWESGSRLGDTAWKREQQALIVAVAEAWMRAHGGWPTLAGMPDAQRDGFAYPPGLLAVAGWTTLADWIGSMNEHMPPDAASYDNLAAYIPVSRRAARKALAETKLDDRVALRAASGDEGFRACFPEMFDDNPHSEPRALQRTTAGLDLPDGPALVIIEAPTGEGKSEAAFHLAARLQARRADGGRGVYLALPTQATSNGLFPRFLRFLEQATGGAANVQLVHGASGLNADLNRLLQPQDRDEAAGSSAYAARWFLPSKRGLLAPYGVGTVDQALLGALVSRHFFLRLYGLAGKCVVFDEVHAYDTYMAALFERLLRWLRALDCDVVVLSATLPATMRRRFLKAWGTKPPEDEAGVYPAVTVAEAGAARLYGPFATMQAERTERAGPTEVAFAGGDEHAVARRVADFVRQGATVGVIVNLVDRAQRIFRLLTDAGLDADLELLHARFPFAERQAREHRVVGSGETPGRFGKRRREAFGDRPAVLVATQVAEQSLDLDVDVLLTDLAPVDLLLQRAGRMHRHDLPRPAGFECPRLLILCPNADADDLPNLAPLGGPRKEGDLKTDLRAVYLSLPLFKTYRLLRDRRAWRLPHDYRPLVEAVYGPDTDAPPPDLSETDRVRWAGAVRDRDALEKNQTTHARDARIAAPERLRELVSSGETADRSAYDEHADVPARDFRPVTRLGRDTVEVVCLVKRDGRVTLDGAAPLPDTPAEGFGLGIEDVRKLLRRGVRLGRAGIVRALRTDEAAGVDPETAVRWGRLTTRTPALAYHYPLVFEHGRCTVGGTTLALDPDLGIVYDPDRLFDR